MIESVFKRVNMLFLIDTLIWDVAKFTSLIKAI